MHKISDQTMFHWLRELGVARSQYHVSALCGRSPGWFSSTRCQGRDILAKDILVLVRYAHQRAEQETEPLAQERLRIVIKGMETEAAQRTLCKRKRTD
ncbi:hypothetical protein [Sediminicoccus sp. BL-A-41-H5]|uniref:hypothetical protein n=1 Tax=Sediminicoccus sp. BL-A-41-H5 TaxID=3421106 RepID=UPI003D67EA66